MGNVLKKTKKLEKEVKALQEKLDKNNYGLVSKTELDAYFVTLSEKIDDDKNGTITQLELENYVENYVNDELTLKDQEIESWKAKYNNVLNKHELLEESLERIQTNGLKLEDINDNVSIRDSFISHKAVKEYIENEIIDSDSNLGWIPDAIERRAYFTIYKTVMEILEKTFNTTKIEFFNHQMTFKIEPVPEYTH